MRTDVYKHIRGTWQPTVFSLERKDFCRFIEDPNDMIYSFTQNLPELRCPFTEGVCCLYMYTYNIICIHLIISLFRKHIIWITSPMLDLHFLIKTWKDCTEW